MLSVFRAELFGISIHAPTRGATDMCAECAEKHVISIHAPTRGATVMRLLKRFPQEISIHAPTRGATSVNSFTSFLRGISIHAPTRGATCCRYSVQRHLGFQSTLPRGERQDHKVKSFPLFEISIHAPPRGATVRVRWIYCSKCISIHAPTRGATCNRAEIHQEWGDFNPRSHEGSDHSQRTI